MSSPAPSHAAMHGRVLQPLRILSPASSPIARPRPATQKRRVENESHGHSSKKHKLHRAAPTTPGLIPFKVPALPSTPRRAVLSASAAGAARRVRLPTPSSSTIAASSSPPRGVSESDFGASESDLLTVEVDPAYLAHGETLIFGRHRNAYTTLSLPASASAGAGLDATWPTRSINLPRGAAHASRVHAAVQLLPRPEGEGEGEGTAGMEDGEENETYRLLVLGQNGLRYTEYPDGPSGGARARRLKSGQWVDLTNECLVDFYGCALRIVPPAAARARTHASSPPVGDLELASLPPSSPPMMPLSPLSALSDVDADAESDSGSGSPLSPPTSPSLGIKRELLAATPLAAELTPTRTGMTTTPAVATTVKAPTATPAPTPSTAPRAPSPIPTPPVPADIDLPALLANTVVFSGSSKLSMPDLVRHMLETQPSLRAHADETLWGQWASEALEGNPMFGKVQRNGKDASGHPLLAHFFYNPAADPDVDRAKQLGGLVRPLRAAQRAGGKALDWRPVGGGRRR